jgi:hypothetical protein
MIDYVAQEEDDGCVVACLAMVVGATYSQIRAMVDAQFKHGMHQVVAHGVLAELGYAVATRYRHVPHLRADRPAWPCLPFARAHICWVTATRGAHAVVMLSTGDVYDPWTRDRGDLLHPDYREVGSIDGVFHVGHSSVHNVSVRFPGVTPGG